MGKRIKTVVCIIMLFTTMLTGCNAANRDYIINVSYDPTRELYEAYNQMFIRHWKEQTGSDIDVIQSHGGSGKQALEVSNGLEADVVTLALEQDIRAIADQGMLNEDFTDEFPDDSAPSTHCAARPTRPDWERICSCARPRFSTGILRSFAPPARRLAARRSQMATWPAGSSFSPFSR